MTHKNRKKYRIFRGFEVLDVHFLRLKASGIAWASFIEA
jgi:hypothetical protein